MVGVDIGATAVRVAEVAGIDTQGFAIVTRAGFSPMKEGAVVGGKINNPEQAALALQRALKAAGVPRRGFILGFASPDTAITRMALPASIKPAERESAIRAGDHQVAPNFSTADAVIATNPMYTEMMDDVPMVTLAVGAALQSDIDTVRAVCKLAGCEPRALDLSGAAILRSMTRATPDSQEIATVVDIGASKITMATRIGLHLASMRTITGGGVEISRGLMTVTGASFEEVERMKTQMRVPSAFRVAAGPSYLEDEPVTSAEERTLKAAEKSLGDSTELIVEAIAQSIEGDSSAFGEMTQGITLIGGTARLRGVKERLQQRLGSVQVAVGKPWLRLERSQRNALFFQGGQEDPVAVMDLAAAVGLALWKEPV